MFAHPAVAVSFALAAATAARATVLTITSGDAVLTSPVTGNIASQLATLNTGVAIAPYEPVFIFGGNYAAGQDVPGAPDVSRNNQQSAFYRYTFSLPCGFEQASMTVTISSDDQGTAFLNGTAIAGLMTSPSNFGGDALGANGLPILTWPSVETLSVTSQATFHAGLNELVFAICGDCSSDPTGIDFVATIEFEAPIGLDADFDDSGSVDGADLGVMLGSWGACPGCPADLDCNDVVNGGDVGLLLANWS